MVVVHGASLSKKNNASQISAEVVGTPSISFVICYIIFRTRISIKGHMNRGAHLLATGPAGVDKVLIRSVWGDKAQERERVQPCNVYDKAFNSLQMLSQYKI